MNNEDNDRSYQCEHCLHQQPNQRGLYTARLGTPHIRVWCRWECFWATVQAIGAAKALKPQPLRHEFGEEGWDGGED